MRMDTPATPSSPGPRMDENVLAAMARWPDVPHAHGWLSLDARGRLRLHPDGASAQGGAGEPITHAGVLDFLHRHYTHDERGAWYIQNGPQRAYVRLDAAPYILRRGPDGKGLWTHTGLRVAQVSRWILDDDGHVYACTEHGPGRVEDRELASLLADLRDAQGLSLLDAMEGTAGPGPWQLGSSPDAPAALEHRAARDIPQALGFLRQTTP
ncbi:hypothetical protein RAN3_1054 [plant metagenome]|uniref:DUF2946 family protein n=1 Tax=plant metagenome TaxID=1297885 RepID=A0A484V1X2_9ZZZZ